MEKVAMNSPIGRIVLEADAEGLASIQIGKKVKAGKRTFNKHLKKASQELREYFEGKRTTFSVKYSVSGTKFQRNVWSALNKIPHGNLVSYSDIAKAIGNPGAVRAVGFANKKNPLPILVPCHRVINKNGKLGGYNLGLSRKRWLLRHEKTYSA